jgi:hypothetical protein
MILNDTQVFRLDHLPFGGAKAAGLDQEGERYAMEELTDVRLLPLKARPGGKDGSPQSITRDRRVIPQRPLVGQD